MANSRRFASHSTINLLQQQEQIANNELNNPQAQLEFYKTLLAYNYPHILVQRFETPGIASSPECVQLYIDALNKVGQTAKAAEVARQQEQHQHNIKPTEEYRCWITIWVWLETRTSSCCC